ncbi:vesicle-associated membrane protein 8 isoform X1 [Heterodontus francisci]|uniref:vesicle-associated membrane protein 8 isoform X1 n=1 Tax=Heterodontus francisci TaxID=7792 RepID=UPI00355BD209
MASYSVDPGPEKLSNLQGQVNDVKGIMSQNIEKVLERGEKLDDLIIKTDDLQASADSFQKTSTKIARKMWWKNKKMIIIIVISDRGFQSAATWVDRRRDGEAKRNKSSKGRKQQARLHNNFESNFVYRSRNSPRNV